MVTQVKLQPDTEAHIRGLVTNDLSGEDVGWFADWLLLVGLATVNRVVEEHPELTFADLIQMGFFRDSAH